VQVAVQKGEQPGPPNLLPRPAGKVHRRHVSSCCCLSSFFFWCVVPCEQSIKIRPQVYLLHFLAQFFLSPPRRIFLLLFSSCNNNVPINLTTL
jgi:hypothetical protein